MGRHRTGGMTTVGVLNIIFGSLGCLIGLLMVLGGGFMAAGGMAMGAEGTEEAQMMSAGAATMGGVVVFIGVGMVAINMMLFISGIGVLKVASWGRTLGIAYGVLALLVYGAMMVTGGIGAMTLGGLAYSVILLAMFYTPTWKAAFSGGGTMTDTVPATSMGTTDTTDTDETREAA